MEIESEHACPPVVVKGLSDVTGSSFDAGAGYTVVDTLRAYRLWS